MKTEPTHAAEPPPIGKKAPAIKHAAPLCSMRGAMQQPRTYRPELVTCRSCQCKMRDRPQLPIAMRLALQLELPSTNNKEN